MNNKQAKIEALRHAISVCDSKRLRWKHAAYNAACDEIKISLEAAIERLEAGEDMPSVAYVQSQTNNQKTKGQ